MCNRFHPIKSRIELATNYYVRELQLALIQEHLFGQEVQRNMWLN